MTRSEPFMIRLFNYRFHLNEFILLFLTYFFAEGVFSWLLIPSSAITLNYAKVLSLLVYGFVLFYFKRLKRSEKIVIGLFTVLMIKLVFESLVTYGTFFQQFTLFSVVYPVVYVIFIKAVCRSFDFDLLEFIAKFYLFTYILFMLVYGHGFSFSLEQVDMDDYGPFSGDSRIIHARSILMIIIPYLWYLNKYIQTRKWSNLLWFFLCFTIILIHQHRSVWSCTIFATVFYILLALKSSRKNASGFFNLVTILLLAGSLALVYLSNLYPGFLSFMSDRFSEILNPAKEGSTGNFRIDQTEVYGEMIKQKPWLGWSFGGFYVRNPLVDWWDENSGQHFHEGFIEILFYHGIAGLLLKYFFLGVILIKAFTRTLSQQAIILIPFCVSGLLFSLSYVLPVVFWAHVGLCLYYLEKKNETDDLHSYSGA